MDYSPFVHRKAYGVTASDCDMEGRLRVGALMNFMVQSAIASADALGFGFKDIGRSKLIWVLSRISIEIYSTAHWYDHLTIETWPKDHEGLLYFRDFVVKDEQGKPIVSATSGWLAIDVDSKRPRPMEYFRQALFDELKDLKALDYRPPRLPACQGEACPDYRVAYFDLDINRHMTTTRYFDVVMDCFDMEFHRKHYPGKLEFNFMNEAQYGQELMLYKEQTADGEYLLSGRARGEEKDSFRSKVSFLLQPE